VVRHLLTKEQVAELGERLYDERLRTALESEHHGRFVVLDVISGDYEIDDRDIRASSRLLKRKPDGVLYGLRIGYPAAYRLGSSLSGSWSRP
jgi:hypothetical protein